MLQRLFGSEFQTSIINNESEKIKCISHLLSMCFVEM